MKKIFLLLSFLVLIFITTSFFYMKEKQDDSYSMSDDKNNEVLSIADTQKDLPIYNGEMEKESKQMEKYFNLIDDSKYLAGQLSVSDEYIDRIGKIDIYSNTTLGIDWDYLVQIDESLENYGWNRLECNIYDEYSFIMKSEDAGTIFLLDEIECKEQAEIFLEDSGLSKLFEEEDVGYEIESITNNGLNESFCYLLYEGKRTGGYIRFIFQDKNVCEECQAYLYKSILIGSADIIPLESALKNAFYIEKGTDILVDDTDYNIGNIEIIYVNGIPYYSFSGYGKNSRTAITGYSLAVDIETFDGSVDILYEAIKSFCIY